MDTQMLIGSKFETGTETPETVLNPKTEETLLELPGGLAGPDRRRGKRRRDGVQDLVAHHADGALLPLAQAC